MTTLEHPKRPETHDASGKFKKGNPGGPGRPKGQTYGHNAIRAALVAKYGGSFESAKKAFWGEVIDRAADGDSSAQQLVAKRLAPEMKAETSRVAIRLSKDSAKAARELIDLAAAGTISVDHAKVLLSGIGEHLRAVEHSELTKRLEALETTL